MISRLHSFFSAPSGFGTAGIRRQRICGAVTVLGSGNLQFGVEHPETGGTIETFTVRYFLETDVPVLDNFGEVRGRVKSSKVSREITAEFEVNGPTGLMAMGFLTACSFANDIQDFGDGTGTPLLQEVTITQNRGEWRKGSMKFLSNPGLVI